MERLKQMYRILLEMQENAVDGKIEPTRIKNRELSTLITEEFSGISYQENTLFSYFDRARNGLLMSMQKIG